MVNADNVFNTSGKFATDSNIWDVGNDTFVTSQGITPRFSKVIGEQVFKPLKDVRNPMYREFAGRPLNRGVGWMERLLAKNVSRHFKPKATANDDLSFYDSEGIEKIYQNDVNGWVVSSMPSELESAEMMLDYGGVGELNSMLVDNVNKTYQRDIESIIEKKVVSTISHTAQVDFTNGVSAVKDINKLGLKMMSTQYHYNELSEGDNAKVYTQSDDVICFIDAEVLESMRDSFASLPSPDRISENVRYIPMVDGMPTPLTLEEYDATKTDASGTVITWTTPPVAMGGDKPIAILTSKARCEYRPYINGYKVNLSKNGAGDFTNEHLIYKGAVGIRPWENAIRVYQSE